MYVETIKKCERLLLKSKKPIPLTDDYLKFAYKFLCKAEKIKPGKIRFHDPAKHKGKMFKDFDGGVCIWFRHNFVMFAVNRFHIYVKRDELWLLKVFHEVTHQILIKDGRGHRHGKIFFELQDKLIEKYFNVIFLAFNSIIEK